MKTKLNKKIFNKKSYKFALLVIGSALLIFALVYTFLLVNITTITKALPASTNLSQDLENWAKQVEFLKLFPDSDNKSFTDILVMRNLDTYIKNYTKFNDRSLIKLPKIEFFEYTEDQKIDPALLNQKDDKFFDQEKYRSNVGVVTFTRNALFKLKIDDAETQKVEIQLVKKDLENYSTDITGSLAKDKVIQGIKDSFNSLLNYLERNNSEQAKNFIAGSDIDNAIKQILSINIISDKMTSITPVSFDLKLIENGDTLEVGKLNIAQKGSTYVNTIDVIYDRTLKTFKFSNLYDSFSQIPVPGLNQVSITPNQVQTINCTDCTLAPVDKLHALPSTYIPTVINTTITGGGQLTSATVTALNDLNNDASSKGIDITIISAYRSYQTQVATFNYWVGEQKKKGLSQAAAESAANQVSARAGQSEHQLGTVIDLRCSSCTSFDNTDPKNMALYKYIEENAYKFGFVISYPKNKELLTGYSYEPWHIRFIGIELATQFFNKHYLTDPSLSSTILLRQLQ